MTLASEKAVVAAAPHGTRLSTALSDQRVRFVIVGAFNTAFGAGLFVALHFTIEHSVGYLVVLTLTWVIAVLAAFMAYRYLVFRVRGSFFLDLSRFSLVYLGLYLVNLAVLPLLVELAGLPVLLAQAATFPIVATVSYVGHHRFSFRRAPKLGG
jgi:putative flippase GtrA